MHVASDTAFVASAAGLSSGVSHDRALCTSSTKTSLTRFTLTLSRSIHPLHFTSTTTPLTIAKNYTQISHQNHAIQRLPSNPTPSSPPRRILLWFHSDLRTSDNSALSTAAEQSSFPGGVLIPYYAHRHSTKCCQSFHHKAVQDLRKSLRKCGSDLIARDIHNKGSTGVAKSIINICKEMGIQTVYWNWGERICDIHCQKNVEKILNENGLKTKGFWNCVLNKNFIENEIKTKQNGAFGKNRKELNHNIDQPKRIVDSLTSVPNHLIDESVIPVGSYGVVENGWKLLNEMNKNHEVLNVRKGGEFVLQLKNYLDCGILSPRIVAAHVKKVLGRYNGYTFNELVWRSCVCASMLCRSRGRQAAAVVA